MVTYDVLPAKTALLLKPPAPITIYSRLLLLHKNRFHLACPSAVDHPFTPYRQIALCNPRRIINMQTPHFTTHSESHTCKCLGGIALTANSIRTIAATSRSSRPASVLTPLPEIRPSRVALLGARPSRVRALLGARDYNDINNKPMTVAYSTEVKYLKGVGPQRAATLATRGIHTVGDLLGYLPFRYEDRIHFTPIAEIVPGGIYTFRELSPIPASHAIRADAAPFITSWCAIPPACCTANSFTARICTESFAPASASSCTARPISIPCAPGASK